MRLTKYAGYTRPAPVPTMPPGVVELMEGLTKEVLRHNPPELYQFCADHFEQLLVIRDGRAPKKTLTLEQKISRAQQKVRERAEQRRRKYDEDMKKYAEEVKNSSNAQGESTTEKLKSPELVQNNKHSSNDQDEPRTEKLKSPEFVQDNKLKAPVHHEQDLTDALEVEIFHKPIEEVKIGKILVTSVETINNNNESSLVKDNVEVQNETKVNEEFKQSKGEDTSQEETPTQNFDSTVSDTDSILENNKSSSVDDNIVENDKEDVPAVHNRMRRSVASEESNEEIEQSTLEFAIKETQIETPQEEAVLHNHPEAKTEEVKEILLEKDELPNDFTNAENIEKENVQVSDNSVLEENDTGIESSNNKDDTIDQKDQQKEPENDINHEENDLNDKAEVEDEKAEIETPKAEQLHGHVSISTNELNDGVPMNLTLELESTDAKIDSNLEEPHKNAVETKEEITQILQSTEENLDKHAETFSEKVDKVEENVPETVGTVDEKTDDKLNESYELTNTKETIAEEKLLPLTENVDDKEESKHDPTESGEAKDFQKKELEIIAETKNEKSADLQNFDTVSAGNTDLGGQNTEFQEEKVDTVVEVSTTKTEPSDQIEESQKKDAVAEIESSNIESEPKVMTKGDVCEERNVVEQENKVDIITETESSAIAASGNDTNVLGDDTKHDNETASPKIENGSATEEHGDGSLTTVNKVLVDEPAVVKDDNDSVPVEITTAEVTENNVNGKYEKGKETPDSEAISNIEESSNQEVTKDVQNISDIPDNLSTTSEPVKTDNETSSLGKSSSMDDSFIEDSNNSILDVELKESNAESKQNKESSSSMDLETAAVTIQKVFRSFLFKSRGSTFDETGADGNNSIDNEKVEVQFPVSTAPSNKERRPLGISRMDTVLQTVNEEKSLSLSTDDSSLSSAATIIQAHVRGFLVRNRRNSNKTNSTSLVISDGRSTSLDGDSDQKANKTVLNIHIVPEGEHFLSRDESLLTSIDLSLDGSPPSSTNLHPLGYDKSEPRKQLKREDAIQSISPPSNNSGKLSEDVDSVKDMIISDEQQKIIDSLMNEPQQNVDVESRDDTPTKSTTIETVIEAHKNLRDESSSTEEKIDLETGSRRERSIEKYNSDESDVITPFEEKDSLDSGNTSRLLHSGEFHDVVLPTKVSRSDTTVVRGE